ARFASGSAAGGHLARLPNRPYVYASSFDLQGVKVADLVTDLAAGLPAKGPGTGLGSVIGKAAPLAQQILGGATAFYAPSQEAMPGAGLINCVTILQVRDTA